MAIMLIMLIENAPYVVQLNLLALTALDLIM